MERVSVEEGRGVFKRYEKGRRCDRGSIKGVKRYG